MIQGGTQNELSIIDHLRNESEHYVDKLGKEKMLQIPQVTVRPSHFRTRSSFFRANEQDRKDDDFSSLVLPKPPRLEALYNFIDEQSKNHIQINTNRNQIVSKFNHGTDSQESQSHL